MTKRIFTLKSGEAPEAISEMPFDTEADLQALLAAHPELLDGEQISPGNPRRWMLIKSEKGVSETVGSALRWSVDILLVDQDATPTLIEIKRGSNPENRRAVVGQLLEYAAHASKTWSMAELRRDFAEHCSAPMVAIPMSCRKDCCRKTRTQTPSGRIWPQMLPPDSSGSYLSQTKYQDL